MKNPHKTPALEILEMVHSCYAEIRNLQTVIADLSREVAELREAMPSVQPRRAPFVRKGSGEQENTIETPMANLFE